MYFIKYILVAHIVYCLANNDSIILSDSDNCCYIAPSKFINIENIISISILLIYSISKDTSIISQSYVRCNAIINLYYAVFYLICL